MDQVVVVSQRVTAGLARAAQQDAENIVNVLGGAEIRKLPVVNAGDAVRRIPGVQLETDTGEGRFVNIRGLDSDLSSTTFGGVRLPPTDVTTSPYGGSRAVSFDNIPAEMIGSVTVTKTNRPEQEAEAVGGTIEITPKTVPRGGRPYFADVKLGSGYEPLRGTRITDLALTVGGRFGAAPAAGAGALAPRAPFSLIGVFSSYADRRGVDDLEGSYYASGPGIPYKALNTFEQRYYRQRKQRHVVGGEFDWSPAPGHEFYLRYYDFGATQHYNRNGLLYTFQGNPVAAPDGSVTETGVQVQKYYRANQESFDTRLASIGGRNRFDRYAIDYFLAHTEGRYRKPFDQIPVWTQAAPAVVTYNNIADANHPSLAVSGINPADPAGYALTGFSNSTQSSTTKDWSAKLNVTVPTQFTSYETEQIKFGVGARRRRFVQDVGVYSATQLPAIPLAQAVAGPGITYYDGRYAMGPLIEPGAIAAAFDAGTGFAHDPVADAATGAQSSYRVHEDVYAAYGQ